VRAAAAGEGRAAGSVVLAETPGATRFEVLARIALSSSEPGRRSPSYVGALVIIVAEGQTPALPVTGRAAVAVAGKHGVGVSMRPPRKQECIDAL